MGKLLKPSYSLWMILCLVSLLTTLILYKFNNKHEKPHQLSPQKESAPKPSDLCEGCRKVTEKVAEYYSQTWKKQEENYHRFRLQLKLNCNGYNNAIITQDNTPVGSMLAYAMEKKILKVTSEFFKTFTKEHPFSNKIWHTCSVVGNGGILVNSSCGKMIDSADFVIRCNLPPLEHGYGNDVGMKSNLVTANPSVLLLKYGSLTGRRRPFVDSLRKYGNSLLLFPAFSISIDTLLCQRAVYTSEELGSPIRPVFFNPQYLKNLTDFWHSRGLKEARLSTGIIMASLALEFCENVHLYGFWPFRNHPFGHYPLSNHYYDNIPPTKVHAMPREFDFLLQLHHQGVLRLHLEDCKPRET